MAQTTDIVLNSAGYMIEPNSYKRLQDGMAEGRTQRTSITDFFGGGNRALQLERDTFGQSLNVGPALNGQGLIPWGYTTAITASGTGGIMTTFPERNTPIPHVIVRDRLVFAIGKRLYQGPTTNGVPVANVVTMVKEYADTITDLCIYQSKGILIAFGSAADMLYRDMSTGTEVALLTGERAFCVEAYAGRAIWNDARAASTPNVIRMAKSGGIDFRVIEHDVTAITRIDGELLIVTEQALYTFSGRVKSVMIPNPAYPSGNPPTVPPSIPGEEWSGEFTPFYQQGVITDRDDFAFVLGYGGRTIAWIAGGVHELVPSGDRAGWRSTGLEGKRCFGGTVAAGYVIVCLESHAGRNEVWAYNGSGWYRLADKAMPATLGWCWPLPLGTSGVTGSMGFNTMIFQEGSNTVALWRLAFNEHGSNYPASAQVVTPLIDAGERDKLKAWRKFGAVFAAPHQLGNLASVDPITLYLDYSIDGGATWTIGDSIYLTGNTLANMNLSLESPLSGAISRFILVRVRWTSVVDWAPVLTGIWVEHEALESPARRRKWTMKIHARDQEIDRDGVMLTRTGRQLIAELWSAWQTDTVLTFRDIDYDDAPTQRSVRIVGIHEAVAQPADSNEWGDSVITLQLVEV